MDDPKRVVIAAHRGYSAKYPENTLLAFERALEIGADMIELDLRFTADKRVAVIHDATVDRVTNGHGDVAAYTLEALQALDAGRWKSPDFTGCKIPTIEETIALLAPTDVLLNVEIKDPDVALCDSAVDAFRAAGMLERCVFTSFHAPCVHYIARVKGQRCQGFPAHMMKGFEEGPLGTYSCLYAMGIPMRMIGEWVPAAKALGILPWPYCPDDPENAVLAAQAGVTLVTCNDPLPAIKVFKDLGLR